MATIPSPLHLPTAFFRRRPQQPNHSSSSSVKSSDTDTPPPEETSSSAPTPEDDGAFENRLSQVRLRYRSGTGKKAELRKAKKAGYSSSASSSSSSLYLPPVSLKEPKSFDGSKVEIGFSPYSEKINGRIAMLGLTALLLVELATGKGVINYHTPAIILIQVYFVAAAGAIWIKYEKESVAIWPKSD